METELSKKAFAQNAKIYKILANEKRLEILNNIKNGERAVEDLLKITGLSRANLSQHLAMLRHTGLVTCRKAGVRALYSIVDSRIVRPCVILHQLRQQGKIS